MLKTFSLLIYYLENPCESDPCLNGGTCFNDDQGFECFCVPEYTGQICASGKTLLIQMQGNHNYYLYTTGKN